METLKTSCIQGIDATVDLIHEWALEKIESRLRRDTNGLFTESTNPWQIPEIKGLL